MVRILPDAAPGESIVDDPEFDEKLPRQALLEMGMGIAVAQANSEAFLAQERAIAESLPFGFSVKGDVPHPPGAVSQTALPDHEEPTTSGLEPPPSPLDELIDLGVLKGSAHARWDKRLGPCVKPIADAGTTLADVSAVNVLPSLEGARQRLESLPAGGTAPGAAPDSTRALREAIDQLRGPLSRLGGLLRGASAGQGERGSLLRISDVVRAHSNIRLVDVPGQDGKAVRATSEFELADIRLFAGTSQELRIQVVSQPTLVATATGDPNTSTVEYSAPVLRISRGGAEIATLDAADPTFELPIGIPLPDSGIETPVPLIGHRELPNVLDIGVLKLSLGELRKGKVGTEVRAGVRLLDIKILPTDVLGVSAPSALARISFGEQFVRAKAPEGGVHCDLPSPSPAPNPEPDDQQRSVPPLAKTSGAYHVIPLFWTGTALLLLGAVLVAALPRRR